MLKVVVFLVFPTGLLLGFLGSDIFLSGVSDERVIEASKAVLDFDGFLTVGWTIGFGLIADLLQKEQGVRIRTVEIERGKDPVAAVSAKRFLEELKKPPSRVFSGIAVSIFSIVVSAFFAVRGILLGGRFLLW